MQRSATRDSSPRLQSRTRDSAQMQQNETRESEQMQLNETRDSAQMQQNETRDSSPPHRGAIETGTTNVRSLQETADIDNTDFFYGLLFDDPITLGVDSDEEQASTELGPVGVIHTTPILSLQEILTGLAQAVNGNKISKFNIARNDIWEGTKRGLTRKSFTPCNKMSIRFSDDSGKSEGAVDLGGPTREFLILVLEWLANSHLFCGPKQAKFLSCNASGLASSEYLYAGKMAALSLVHGGPGPSFFPLLCMMLWSRVQTKCR